MGLGRSGTHTRPAGRDAPPLNSREERAIYAVLFRIGEFEVTSSGLLVVIAALVGLWLLSTSVLDRACRTGRSMPPRPKSAEAYQAQRSLTR